MQALDNKSDLYFIEFPLFAHFIKENHLEGFVFEQIRLSKELQLPILKYFESMPEEEFIATSKISSSNFLICLSENKASQRIKEAQLRWTENKIEFLKSDQITIRDIALVSYIQKQAFLKILPLYTNKTEKIIVLIQEMDRYFMEYEMASTNTYVEILKNKLGVRETQLLEAQALSHVGNWIWDIENKKLIWTDELYRIYELEPQSPITNEKIGEFNHPDDSNFVKQHIHDSQKNNTSSDFVYRIILKNNTIKYLHARGETQKDKDGRILKMFGTVQDVTSQKVIENELKENQKFIQKIADTAPTLIAVFDVFTGKYKFINAAIQNLLGYTQQQLVKEGISFLKNRVHPDDKSSAWPENFEIMNGYESTTNKEPIREFKYRLRNANDAYRWFHTYSTVFSRNAMGTTELVLNISVDITDKMEAEQVLSQKNSELQQSNTNLEEFAYIASHDLKEPLRKISILADKLLITQQAALNENGKNYLTKIVDASQRMQTMINDLLSVSTITGDRAFTKFSLETIFNEVLQTLEYKIESQEAIIHTDRLPSININIPQFRQLFQNLLSNSLKFSKKNVAPRITITHKFLSEKQVKEFDLMKADKYLQLKFSDNGIGFENEYSNKIFSIFKRLHSKSEYEGTGIGLSICKKIVENHNGVIFAFGKPNDGAVFTIILPIV